MKLLVFGFAFGCLLCLQGSHAQPKPGNPRSRSQHAVCDLCHHRLNECKRFGFKNEEERRDTQDFLNCFGPSIGPWLIRVKARIPVQWRTYANGPINRVGNKYDRVSCFQYYIYQDTKCIQCGIDHTEGVSDLRDASDRCRPQGTESAEIPEDQPARGRGRGVRPPPRGRVTQSQGRQAPPRGNPVAPPVGTFPRGLDRRTRILNRRARLGIGGRN